MKILLLNSDCGYGSTGRICVELYQKIISSGNESCIAYGRECTDYDVKTIRIGDKLDVYGHVLKTRLFDMQGFGSQKATNHFIKKCEQYHPDIIHLHNIHGSYINIELLFEYLKKWNGPVIWTLHDCWSFTGHCAYYTYANCNKWKNGCHHCIQKTVYPKSYFLDRSRKNYEDKKHLFQGLHKLTITTVSNWLHDEVKQSFLKDVDSKVIPNGIDLNIFKPTSSSFREKYHLEKSIVLLGVASIWHDRKGLWLFEELVSKLDDRYKIVLVGVTQKQAAHLSKDIITIERTNHIKELVEIYSAADVFLNPSIEETFGMVSLEALACGTPVITNLFSANPELVNNECGRIVREISADCFLEAINDLEKNPVIFENCIKKANENMINQCYQKYLNLYDEVRMGS